MHMRSKRLGFPRRTKQHSRGTMPELRACIISRRMIRKGSRMRACAGRDRDGAQHEHREGRSSRRMARRRRSSLSGPRWRGRFATHNAHCVASDDATWCWARSSSLLPRPVCWHGWYLSGRFLIYLVPSFAFKFKIRGKMPSLPLFPAPQSKSHCCNADGQTDLKSHLPFLSEIFLSEERHELHFLHDFHVGVEHV